MLSLPIALAISPAVFPVAPAPLALLVQDEEARDLVLLRNGTTESGNVLDETLAGLTLDPAEGARKTLPWDSVSAVQYGDAPDEFTNAQAALDAGNMELALEGYQAVLAGEELRPVIRQQALFYSAHAQLRLGQTADAVATYTELLGEFPQGRFVLAAGENLIDLHLQSGDEAAARTALDKIRTGLDGADSGPAVAGLLEAGLIAAGGDFAQAGERYGALESGPDAALAQEARLGRARMLLAAGKRAEAEPMLRALVAESHSARVQSGAWNALGEALTADGVERKAAEPILDGLYAYLRTVVQYKPLPGESTVEYERALAGAEQCFQHLSELEQNAEKKESLRAQQRQRLAQLQNEFPNSRFLRKE
jgi:tetratricopeptide (TPR) repeat protein